MIFDSYQFDYEDRSMIQDGLDFVNEYLEEAASLSRDLKVKEYRPDNLIVCANIKRKDDDESPYHSQVLKKEDELILKKGDEKICSAGYVDRSMGFNATKLSEELVRSYNVLKRGKKDFVCLTDDQVSKVMGSMCVIDWFRPPGIRSGFDSDVVATSKKIYYNYLRKIMSSEDRCVFLGGNFGVASKKDYGFPSYCIYYNEERFRKACENRKSFSISGKDFFLDTSGLSEHDIVLRTKKIIEDEKITVVIHDYIYNYIYNGLLDLKNSITLIALCTMPDVTDQCCYCVCDDEHLMLEDYPIDMVKAKLYGFQILYENDKYSVVYYDHGRYIDWKPYNYDSIFPLCDIASDFDRSQYVNLRHMSITMTGVKKMLIKEWYSVPEKMFLLLGSELGTVDIKYTKDEYYGETNFLVGYDYLYDEEGEILLDSEGEKERGPLYVFDIEMPVPYWQRRINLYNLGFNLYDQDSEYKIHRSTMFSLDYSKSVKISEMGFFRDILEYTKCPFFELRGVGYNPILKQVVEDDEIVSYMYYDEKISIPLSRTFDVLCDGTVIDDPDGILHVIFGLTYSEHVCEVPFLSPLDTDEIDYGIVEDSAD